MLAMSAGTRMPATNGSSPSAGTHRILCNVMLLALLKDAASGAPGNLFFDIYRCRFRRQKKQRDRQTDRQSADLEIRIQIRYFLESWMSTLTVKILTLKKARQHNALLFNDVCPRAVLKIFANNNNIEKTLKTVSDINI